MRRCDRSFLLAALLAGMVAVPLTVVAGQGGVPKCLTGVVRDAAGRPVSGAQVFLSRTGPTAEASTVTGSDGTFALEPGPSGTFLLRVHKDSFRDWQRTLDLPGDAENLVVVSLSPTDANSAAMQFNDKPDFTVAGITDWTAAGGHGSDVNLRASESLAKDTRDLGSRTEQTPVVDAKLEKKLRAEVLRSPESFEANRTLGAFCLRQRQFPDAIAALHKAHALNPADYTTAYELAQALQGAGKNEDAKLLVTQLIASNDRGELHRLFAEIEESRNDPLAAERQYERAVQLDPTEENYFAWGSELLIHRAVEAAIQVFNKGSQLFPRSERMHAGLGASLYANGSYEDAAKRVCSASDLNASDPEPYLFLGRMEQASPRHLPCVEEKLERFSQEHPENAHASFYLAVALLKSGEADESGKKAEALLRNAVKLNPNFAEAYLQLGVLQLQRNDFEQARISFDKAAAADPDFPDPHFRLAQIYKRAGDKEKVSQELQSFERLKRSDAALVEQKRRDIRQFVVVLKDSNPSPSK